MRYILFLVVIAAMIASTVDVRAQRDPTDIMAWEDEMDRDQRPLTPKERKENNEIYTTLLLILLGGGVLFWWVVSSNSDDPPDSSPKK